MKKLKLFLFVTIVFTMLMTVCYAEGEKVSLNVPDYTGSGNLEVSVSLNYDTGSTEAMSGGIVFDNNAWRYVSAYKTSATDIADEGDVYIDFDLVNEVQFEFDVKSKVKDSALLTIVFEPIGEQPNSEGFCIDYFSTVGKGDFASSEILSNPSISTKKIGDKTYTDVAVYTGFVYGATGSTLSFDLTDGERTESYSDSLTNWGIALDGGNLKFKVAAAGADKSVSLTNIVVTD